MTPPASFAGRSSVLCSWLSLWLLAGCGPLSPINPPSATPEQTPGHLEASPRASAAEPSRGGEAALEGSTSQEPDTSEPAAPDPLDDKTDADDDTGAVHDDVPETDLARFPALRNTPRPHPFDALSQDTLAEWLRRSPEKLGSLSIGRPNGGALINAVRFPESDLYEVVAPGAAFASQETVDYLTRSIARVHSAFPNCPKLHIGDVSAKTGGRLSPHLSHQSGRDVDISYFYSDNSAWYKAANANNLDVAKTWAFVRALAIETDVEMILIDASIQTLLRDHAEKLGEDPPWVQDLFRGTPGLSPPLIRHVRGHRTHLHIRFFNPIAQESARRLHPLLVSQGKVRPQAYSLSYTAKKGDSLISVAKRFGISVKTLRRANGMRGMKLYAKKVYAIPRTGTFPSPEVIIPPRRLPSTTPTPISLKGSSL